MPKPFIIPVFIPNAGCPHHCAFCNQRPITGADDRLISPEKIELIADHFLDFKKENRGTVQIAFYGGNFLGLKTDYMLSLLDASSKLVKKGRVDSIRFSTRPDTIVKENLEIISRFPVSTIEIGVQSMDNEVLQKSERGHTCQETEHAFVMLKKAKDANNTKYQTGAQLMVGLPGDDESKCLASCRSIAKMQPDFVRIYPTVVIDGSLLAKWYKSGEYSPMPLEKAVTLVKKIYLIFTKRKIKVIRMGLQASSDLEKGSTVLAGPYHPAFGHMVFSEIFLDKAEKILNMGNIHHDDILIKVHPASISKMRGLKNKNIVILKEKYKIKNIRIVSDPGIGIDDCAITFP
ncbi:MAG: radical SAM protein [Deltaproteobacteria bacterium]|nr:radical SAM protein [Deltaproteobacteria bacterium]